MRSIPDGVPGPEDEETERDGRGVGGNRDDVIVSNFPVTFITAGAFILANVKFSSSFNLYFEVYYNIVAGHIYTYIYVCIYMYT